MNLPNILTLSRIAFAFIIAAFLLAGTFQAHMAAFILFIAASLTDYFDGYLAKKRGLTSNFGKIMDPIADKVLMLFVFTALAQIGLVAWWMVIVIAIREIAVTVSRLKAMSIGKVLAAEAAGKLKTVCQIVCVLAALLFLVVEESNFAAAWFYKVEMAWRAVVHALMGVSVLLTVISGYMYFKSKQVQA